MKIGAKIHWIESCSSTNDLAKELALAGEKEGVAIVSNEQTKGRGRKGRSWYSAKKKGLYLSIILRPPRPNISLLPLVAGIAVNEAIFETVGIRVKLKWPNDLIWEDKKLGGILCESGFLGNRINYVILGIGINMNHSSDDFPEEIRNHATSLKLITKKDLDKKVFLGYLCKALNFWYTQFLQGEEQNVVRTYEENSILPFGKEITAVTENKEVSGVYIGVDAQGCLILESQGRKRSLSSAEITAIKDKRKEG